MTCAHHLIVCGGHGHHLTALAAAAQYIFRLIARTVTRSYIIEAVNAQTMGDETLNSLLTLWTAALKRLAEQVQNAASQIRALPDHRDIDNAVTMDPARPHAIPDGDGCLLGTLCLGTPMPCNIGQQPAGPPTPPIGSGHTAQIAAASRDVPSLPAAASVTDAKPGECLTRKVFADARQRASAPFCTSKFFEIATAECLGELFTEFWSPGMVWADDPEDAQVFTFMDQSNDCENGRKRSTLSEALSDIADTTTNFNLSIGMIAASSAGASTTQSAHRAVPLGMPSQRRKVGTRSTPKASSSGAGAYSASEHVASYLRRAASNNTSLSGCDAISSSPTHFGAARSPGAAATLSFFADCSAKSGAIAAATERPTAPGEKPTTREEAGDSTRIGVTAGPGEW